jgi:carbon storage regulator
VLVLTRREGEALRIGPDISVRVVSMRGNRVRLAIEAPAGVTVHREEIFDRIAQQNREAALDAVSSDQLEERLPWRK